jgi:hypothetical protein
MSTLRYHEAHAANIRKEAAVFIWIGTAIFTIAPCSSGTKMLKPRSRRGPRKRMSEFGTSVPRALLWYGLPLL